MSVFPAPTVSEERAGALGRLLPGARGETPWRHRGIVLRVVFFVLVVIAVAALFGFLTILQIPIRGCALVTAASAIGTAEYLIRKHRFFGTGVESSLWLCGTFAFLFVFPSSGKVEALLAFAAAAAFSGWRLRNAFCGVLAALLVVAYIAGKGQDNAPRVMIATSLVAIAAGLALIRIWKRPSTERLFAALAVVMPVAGYVATIALHEFRTEAESISQIAAILVSAGVILLVIGIVRRDRALLLSAMLSFAMAAIEMRDFFAYTAESKLIGAGVVVAAIALLLSRILRNRTRGFVVTPIRGRYDEAIQIAGVLAVAPHGTPAQHAHTGPELSDSATATDKSFGGAGSGGGF